MKKVKTNMGAKYSMMECEIHISKLDDMVFVLNKSTETIKSIKLTIKNESEKIHHPKPNFSSI